MAVIFRGLLLTLCCILSLITPTRPAAAQNDTQAVITAPVAGEIISGLVTITGSASHPAQFEAYQLRFALAGTEQWFPVTQPIQTPIQDGQLGIWDTSGLPPGQYRLQLQVFLTGSDTAQTIIVENITVRPVQAATSAPTTAPAATPLPPGTPSQATEIPAAAIPALDDSEANAGPVEVASPTETGTGAATVSGAFCGGALIAAALFGVMGGYTIIRQRTRFARRRFIARLEDEA